MNNGLLPRIGTFLILVGCAFIILFIGSLFARETNGLYFLYAVAALFFGLVLRGKPPSKEPTRFASVRKARQRAHQRREEKSPEKTDKK